MFDTECRIKWLDNLSEMDVTIRATDEDDPDDDQIFFYGMRRDELVAAMESGISVEGEWMVVRVY